MNVLFGSPHTKKATVAFEGHNGKLLPSFALLFCSGKMRLQTHVISVLKKKKKKSRKSNARPRVERKKNEDAK